jgi:hypothetical protein
MVRQSNGLNHRVEYLWCDLQREYQDVDWSTCYEETDTNAEFGRAGSACAGGSCDLGDLGLVIAEAQSK